MSTKKTGKVVGGLLLVAGLLAAIGYGISKMLGGSAKKEEAPPSAPGAIEQAAQSAVATVEEYADRALTEAQNYYHEHMEG